ncbi:MAG: hypothetical protein OXH57_13110 [Ekhidna sp.]|nr:hypothetical protein [Ekhidna sp.]
MKIALNEIWNFLNLPDTKEKDWNYALQAGEAVVEQITTETMLSLKKDENYDTELLPSIFTFREILWQPDVFNEGRMILPSLRILQAHCDEATVKLEEERGQSNMIYAHLLRGLGKCSGKAVADLDKDEVDVKKVLGSFRIGAFPIVKFFVYHPMNRCDYFMEAVNRLNYAVKIMLTQFYSRYTELNDPCWVVSFKRASSTPKKLLKEAKEQ